MRQTIVTSEQMRQADQAAVAAGVSTFDLMQRAGQAVADAMQQAAPDTGRMVIVAGGGNNAGDAYAAAKELAALKGRVTVVALVDPAKLKGAAAEHARIAAEAGVKIRLACGTDGPEVLSCWLNRAVLVVDAIFGTGLDREVTGWLREAIGMINASDRTVLAVDVPSGINSDNGKVMGVAVKADWTIPIASSKWGHWLGEGRLHRGRMLSPADIGLACPDVSREAQVLDQNIIKALVREEGSDMHKGSFGHVWVFGGSQGFTGAPRMAAMGAMAVHAGLVSIACPEESYGVIAASSLEAMVHPQATDAWQAADVVVAGPGWGCAQQKMLEKLLQSDRVLLLDADALNMLAKDKKLLGSAAGRAPLTVFTPHPGEAARLLGCTTAEVQADRPAALHRLVGLLHGWVVLKGEQSLVGAPGGRIWLCPFGSSRLATAGTGDVLSGMLGGLVAQGLAPEIALPGGVALHARAGEESGWYRAGQLPDQVAKFREGFL
jgi:ADP-dependent NAD(P)H-hydrate dehydratase / NAD(P)H-hydrate epimerase